MISICVIAGPHAGKKRTLQDNMSEGIEINPLALLRQLTELGSVWTIDFALASANEAFEWGRADIVARIMRALEQGRPVEFGGMVYQAKSSGEIPELAAKLEDAIVYCGRYVTLASDDESGVLIKEVAMSEYPLQ